MWVTGSDARVYCNVQKVSLDLFNVLLFLNIISSTLLSSTYRLLAIRTYVDLIEYVTAAERKLTELQRHRWRCATCPRRSEGPSPGVPLRELYTDSSR